MRQVANMRNEAAGDGTTISTILAIAIFSEGFKALTQGTSSIDMKRGIDCAVQVMVSFKDPAVVLKYLFQYMDDIKGLK